MWNVKAVDAATWQPFAVSLPVSDMDWKRSLNTFGVGSWTIETKDESAPLPETMVSMLMRDGWRTLIVLEWVTDGVPEVVYAGFVTEIGSYDVGTGTLQLRTRDLRAMLEKRGLIPVAMADQRESVYFSLDDPSYLARNLVLMALVGWRTVGNRDWLDVPSWKLPVTVPWGEDYSGSLIEVPVRGRTAEDVMSDVQSMVDGPDVDFQPRWRGSQLEWASLISPDPHVWDVELNYDPHPGAHSQVVGFRWSADFTRQVTGVTAVGNGSGDSMVVGHVSSEMAGLGSVDVDLEESVSLKQGEDQRMVDSLGIAEVRKRRRGTRQFAFDVQTNDTWSPRWFRPGVHVHIPYPGDPGTPAGELSFLVLSVTGDMSTLLGLEVQLVS